MHDIEVKVYRSSLKIPVAFFVPGAFLVTVYALVYLFLNSNIFLNALLGKLDDVFPGSVRATELVISPTLTAAHAYDTHIYSPEGVEVIRADEAHVKLAPHMLLARKIEIYDAVVRRGGVRMTLPEHSEQTFDLLRALGVDKPKDPNDTSEPLIREIVFRNVRCEECFYSIDLGFFKAEIPEVMIPDARVVIGDPLRITVPELNVAALDLTFQHYLFGFPEDQGPWKFRAEDIAIRDWQWTNDGFTVERVSLMAQGVTASATGDMRFPDSKPDQPTQMIYRAGGSIHIPVNTKLGDYFLDEVFHAEVDANISVRGTLDQIEGVFLAEAPYLETQKVKFQYLEARGFLLDDVVFIEQAVADLHGGKVDLTHGIFSMFEGIFAAQATLDGVDPEGVLRDLGFDYPWMSGSANGELTMMGWIPKNPEWTKPGDDPFARIDEATKPVSWIHLDDDVTIARHSRGVLPGGKIRLLAEGEVSTSLETANIPDMTAVFDHVTARISNFHFNWIQNVLLPGLRGSPASVRLTTSDLGGLGADYKVKGLAGGMNAEITALGLMNFPSVDGDLRLKSPAMTIDGTTIASSELSTRFRIRNGRLEFTPVQFNTPRGNLRVAGALAVLRDPRGVIDPLTGRQTSEFLPARSDNASIDFEVSALDLALADRFLKSGMELNGRLDATGMLTGNLSDPMVTIDAALNGQAVGQDFKRVAFEGVFSRRNIEARRFEVDAGDAGRVNGHGSYDLRADTFEFALSGEDVVFERLLPLTAISPVPIEGTSQLEVHGTGSLAQPKIAGYVLIDGLAIDGRPLGGGSVVVNTLGTTVHIVGALPSLATVSLEVPLDAESPFYARLGLDHLNVRSALAELRDSQLVERLDVTGTVETFVDRDFSRYQVLVTLDEFLLDTLGRRFTNRGPIIAGLNDGNLIQIQQAEIGAQGRYVMVKGGIFLDEALLDISLAGSLDMALLNSFRASFPEYFPDAIIDGRGVVELDTNIRGTPNGTLVADGFLKFLPTEIQLRDLPEPVLINSGVVRFSREGLKIDPEDPIRGRALQGIFRLDGSLALSGFTSRDLMLNLQAVNMSYRIPDVANLTFGVNLTLNAPSIAQPETWKVTGAVEIVDGLYYENISIFQEQFTNRILGAFSRQSDAYQASLVERFPILEEVNFDLNIRARDSFRIQSEIDRLGLDLELRLDVQLQNTLAMPRIVGDVDVIDGRVKFQDEKFEVSSGTLTFSGEAKNPYVDIVADSEVSNRCRKTDLGDDSLTSFNLSGDSSSVEQQIFRIILNVQGKLSNLDIQLESNPFADQRDILSLILTGCTVDQITASSASSPTLEVALAPVLGWIEGTVQDAVAVEEFTITPSVDRLRTSVGDRISKRLSWRLQVDTGLADTSSGQLYQLNYKLSDAWSAELSESTKTDDNSFVIDFKLKYRLFLD